MHSFWILPVSKNKESMRKLIDCFRTHKNRWPKRTYSRRHKAKSCIARQPLAQLELVASLLHEVAAGFLVYFQYPLIIERWTCQKKLFNPRNKALLRNMDLEPWFQKISSIAITLYDPLCDPSQQSEGQPLSVPVLHAIRKGDLISLLPHVKNFPSDNRFILL